MFNAIGNIFKKTIASKAFWAGVLLCLTFTAVQPAPAIAEEYDCPSMDVLRERYQGDCFPCQIVNVLLASFMRAAGKTYDVSKEAGNKLLFLGTVLWLAFWALKKMSSLANVEPASMSNELVVFLGKVVVAYCFINAGIGTLVNYAVNPLLGAGADMGTALLLESQNMEISSAPKGENAYKGPTDIVDKSTMDKILKLSEGVSNEVAMNLIIGNALTCFSIKKGIHFNLFIEIHIPDIWLWLVGAAIWCAGFMLVLSVCYYLIDIPFKIGFAIIALPVVIGLWPFKITSGKLKDVVMIALNAAGTFLFLALSSSYAMRLISQSFSNVGGITDEAGNSLTGSDALLHAIYMDNAKYVELVFSFTGGSFLIIMFCYIYGIKMISDITNKYPKEFFDSMLAGDVKSGLSPIHGMATAATMWASKKAAAPFKMAGDIVAHQAGKAATTAAKAAGNVGIGLAGAAAGSVTRSIGTRFQKYGKKMADKAQKDKEAWDSLDRRDSLNQAGLQATVGNKLGKLGSRIKLGLANTAVKAGEHLETGSQYMTAPGERTLSRIKGAWEKGTEEIGAAAKEFGEQLPPGAATVLQRAGQGLSNLSLAGQNIIDDTSADLASRMKEKKLHHFHLGKIVHKVTAPTLKAAAKTVLEVGNKTGMMINKVGEGAADRPDPQDVRKHAQREFAESLVGLRQSGRKLATYIPGTGVAAPEGTLRHAFASLSREKVKTVFSGKAIASAIKSRAAKFGRGIASDWQKDVGKLGKSFGKMKDDVINFHDDIDKKENDSLESIMVSARSFRGALGRMEKDISGAYGELKQSATDLGQTLVNEHKLNTGVRLYRKDDLQNILAEQERLLNGTGNAEAFENLHKKAISDLKDFANGKLVLGKDSQEAMSSFIKVFGTNSKGELTQAGQAAYNRLAGLTKEKNILDRSLTTASATIGSAAAMGLASDIVGAGLGGVGAIAGRHLYNNTKEAVQETMAAWKDGKIDNLFDLAGAVAHPVMAIPLVLRDTASQTVESTYQVAEKTMLAGIDVALTATSILKEPGRDLAHLANIIGHGAKMTVTPVMAGVNVVLDAGDVAFKGVRTITRPVVNTAATIAFAPVGFAAKAVDETLYAAYKMTIRPAAAVGTATVRGAKVLYKGVELGVKSTKIGRGTIRTFKAGGKTLKVGVKTLKLGRDLIRAAAGEGGHLDDPLTQEEREQRRKERKMRRQAEQKKEREKQLAREREELEAERKLQEYHERQAAEEAQRRAEEEAARAQAQAETEQREAAAAQAQAEEEAADANHHQTLSDAIQNEEIESVKNYNNEDLQKILDVHEQLLNGTGNGTAFESLHENSVSDMQKFAEGKVSISQDSYATMGKFIRTFGTDDKGQLTDVGRAAQTKLTSLMNGGNSGGTSGGSKV